MNKTTLHLTRRVETTSQASAAMTPSPPATPRKRPTGRYMVGPAVREAAVRGKVFAPQYGAAGVQLGAWLRRRLERNQTRT